MKILTKQVDGNDRLVIQLETPGEAMAIITGFYDGSVDGEALKRLGIGVFPDPDEGTVNIGRLEPEPA